MNLNSFKRTFAADEISVFERMAVSEDLSGSFIHTSFIQEGDILTAIYEYDGYVKISNCRFKEQIQLLNLMEKVLDNLERVEQYYISPDSLLLTCENIFYRPENEDVRIAYIIQSTMSLRESLLKCCSELKERFAGTDMEYFEEFSAYLEEESASIAGLKEEIKEIRKKMKALK